MEHLALYRKYRPKTFLEVIGQDHIIKTLKNQVEQKEISHAYLFCGTRGTGKTSTAKIFSKAINCLNPINGSPCLTCEVCKSLENPSNLDVLEIDAASNNRVDEIRDLRDKIKYPPVNGKYKVYIIDEVHMLTDSAFNALLKTLEEPPSHAVFILATTEVHKLPATILSRVMRFDFKLVSVNELMDLLKTVFKKEAITCEVDALKLIAQAGEGSVRDTLSVADVCASFSGGNITYESVLAALGTTTTTILETLSGAIIKKDAKTLLTTIHSLYENGKNFGVLTRDLTGYFRNLLFAKNIKTANDLLNLPKEVFEKLTETASLVDEAKLIRYMQILNTMEGELKYAKNERLLFEAATLECIYEMTELERLNKRIEQLEKGKVQLTEKKLASATSVMVTPQEEVTNKIVSAKTEETKTMKENKEVNLTKLWGQFLISVDAQKYPVLYTAVLDAVPTKLENGIVNLMAENELAKITLLKPDNKKLIETFLFEAGIKAALEVSLKEKNDNRSEIEESLKNKFGELLKIIE